VIVAGVVLGGMGSVWGPVIGTVIVEIVSLWIGPFSDYNDLLVGGAVVFFAIAVPRGIVQAWSALMARAGDRFDWHTPDGGAAAAGGAPDPAEGADPTDALGALESPGAVGSTLAAPAGPPPFSPPDPTVSATPAEVIFETRGIRKRFAGVSALNGVDLEVRRGEVVGLIGPNGSGKTTLLNVVTGHVPADGGEALLFGESVLGRSPHAIAGRGVRRTFQVPRLIGELSVVENIRLGLLGARRQEVLGSILQLPGYRARARSHLLAIHQVCDLVGLEPATRAQRVDGLPLGTRRVVEVARAVVSGPTLVCLDEPGAGLGGDALERLGVVMRRVADAGSGVLVIEHNLDFVRAVADRVVEMQDGRVVAFGPTAAGSTSTPGGTLEPLRGEH